ncbi:MAG: ATP synthase F1 subunit delta [Spirochaetia bacterium]|jgi:F-type H+-transporting ATPase subunit delta
MTSSIGRNYARALFDLASESSSREAVEEDLRVVRDALFSDRDVRSFLTNRLISRVTKKRLVRAACEAKVDGRLLTLLFLLVDRDRMTLLGEICEEFERLCRMARGVRKVKVYSAFPLDSEEKTRIARALQARLSAIVELETELRPSLIGGVVVESEGQEMEFSIQGRLRDLAAQAGAGPGRSSAGSDQR